ncbi:wall-associated receptor kinase 2-like [Elaeis guineensis]|uniref:Wall-associated receptor kinase-like 16 n=1 Tax=Elaeis guineensis var. tenera TaxID=51953 RepID=A0A6I9SGZ0_ELAGV|nr:putative wall-associated receptor kinase-like 16 [Elaeis guineensis]
MAWQVAVLLLLQRLSSAFAAAPMARPGCRSECGSVQIPYPFGFGDSSCFLDDFEITCKETTNGPKPFLGRSNLELPVDIDLVNGLLQVNHAIARDCYDRQGRSISYSGSRINLGSMKSVRFSDSRNKFVAIGCDTVGYLADMDYTIWTGCVSYCTNMSFVTNGTCSGIGCCETRTPKGVRAFSVVLRSYYNHTNCSSFSPCSYAFLANSSFMSFNALDYFLTFKNVTMMPVTLEWAVGNRTCEEAREEEGFACVAKNSECYSTNGPGYRCNCSPGYQGNPYLKGGCEDIDECKGPQKNQCMRDCINTPGSFYCTCPRGTRGDGRWDGSRCTPKFPYLDVVLGAGSGFLFLCASVSWLYWIVSKKRLIKLKEKFFQQNGGLLLQHHLSSSSDDGRNDSIMRIFTSEELQRATNNYDEDCIIGQGGFGTVYKGTLSDQRVVAIKKSKIAAKGEIEQFINEVVLLSTINHKNVVKLLGCCLETQVPLLVFEFMSNGTLSHHIHDQGRRGSLSLENRLRIAAEAAEALAYLHSSVSTPIIHRDVKSTNILLDDSYTAKISDFGTSRLVPFDRNCLTSLVRGTIGYLDPEYFQSGQFTDKSDVYSFGVVFIELLTGEKALSENKSEEHRSLVKHFISCMNEGRLCDILDDRIRHEGSMEQLMAVAELVERCIRLNGDERPTMKEVATELEGMRTFSNHPWVNEEIESLLAKPLLSEPAFYGAGNTTSGDNSSHSGLVPLNITR